MAEEKMEPDRDYDNRQHAMLMYCSYKGDPFLWNNWRAAHPGTKIWLVGADLETVHLGVTDPQDSMRERMRRRGVDLSDANLQGANLTDVNLQGATLFNANLQGAQLWHVNLQSVTLCYANLQGADLTDVVLQGVDLKGADLQGAHLEEVNLQGAILSSANLRGTDLYDAELQGTYFNSAHMDGITTIFGCRFDESTDFTSVGLDAATIDPGLKAAFKNNIRRIQWQKWFAKGNWAARTLKNCFVRPFWWMTGYGSSTANIIYYFVVLAYLFGSLYFLLEATGCGVVEGLGVVNMPWYHTWLRGLYFSVVTMTTLGFGDLYAMKTSYWGHALLMFQVILGYVLLGALVTRLGILFTSEAPAAKPTPIKSKDKQSN